MSVKISNCGHDENGHYAGGQAGDQTGTEYQIINWYNRPWLCVLRFEDQEVASLIAEMATQAANNNMIGENLCSRCLECASHVICSQVNANCFQLRL